jgi:tryptophan halogenase
MDAGLYAKYLRKIAEQHGCQRIEGKISDVITHSDTGCIERVILENGQAIEGDLFVDCSGFSGLLIDKTLNTEYDDWSEFLPCDSAVAVQTRSIEEPIPYTRSIAREAGWQWRIPLQHRVGNGMVFCSKYLSDDQAIQTLLDNIDGEALTKPRIIKFTTGQRHQHWNKNCVALGLAAGFLEPLESTSIHLIQSGIVRLLKLFPIDGINQADVDEFNAQMKEEFLFVRDFIVLHYHVTEREDTPFWRHCKTMEIPETLKHRIELFKKSGRIFQKNNDIFAENSWSQVMLGQGLLPENYHPIVNMMTDEELKSFLMIIRNSVNNLIDQLPSHQQFIDSYCKAPQI